MGNQRNLLNQSFSAIIERWRSNSCSDNFLRKNAKSLIRAFFETKKSYWNFLLLAFETTPTSSSLGLKSTESTVERQVMAN
jgi:hypothetical protein